MAKTLVFVGCSLQSVQWWPQDKNLYQPAGGIDGMLAIAMDFPHVLRTLSSMQQGVPRIVRCFKEAKPGIILWYHVSIKHSNGPIPDLYWFIGQIPIKPPLIDLPANHVWLPEGILKNQDVVWAWARWSTKRGPTSRAPHGGITFPQTVWPSAWYPRFPCLNSPFTTSLVA